MPDVEFILAGAWKDDAIEYLRSISAPNVTFTGWLSKEALCNLYRRAAVYVQPSRHEGFAVAPLEAMASGLPVVAADAPGVSDLFEGGEASGGIVVPRGDVTAFATALRRLIDDEDLCRALGARARARVEESFALEAVGARLKEFLTKGAKIG